MAAGRADGRTVGASFPAAARPPPSPIEHRTSVARTADTADEVPPTCSIYFHPQVRDSARCSLPALLGLVGPCGLASAEGDPPASDDGGPVVGPASEGLPRRWPWFGTRIRLECCEFSHSLWPLLRQSWRRRELFPILELWNGEGRKSCVHFPSRKRAMPRCWLPLFFSDACKGGGR